MRLMKKTIKGHTYWYLVESARVNGQPRITWQLYLGKPEDIAARWQGGRPVVVAEFGALAALWSLAERLDLVGIIDRVVPKRTQGVLPGMVRSTPAWRPFFTLMRARRLGPFRRGGSAPARTLIDGTRGRYLANTPDTHRPTAPWPPRRLARGPEQVPVTAHGGVGSCPFCLTNPDRPRSCRPDGRTVAGFASRQALPVCASVREGNPSGVVPRLGRPAACALARNQHQPHHRESTNSPSRA